MPLPVFDTIFAAYRYLWENRRDFAAFAFLPVFAVAIVRTVALVVVGEWQTVFQPDIMRPPETIDRTSSDDMMSGLASANLASGIVSTVVYVMFAVAWHRRYLLGPEPTTIGAALSWGRRQWRFLARLLMLIAILVGLTLIVAVVLRAITPAAPSIALPTFIVAFFLLGLVYARLLLVFPAAAIDQPMTFRESAELTKGNSWRMLGIAILPYFPVPIIGLVVGPVALLLAGIIGPAISALFVIMLLDQAFNFIGIAATVSALSIAYRDLTAQRPTAAPST